MGTQNRTLLNGTKDENLRPLRVNFDPHPNDCSILLVDGGRVEAFFLPKEQKQALKGSQGQGSPNLSPGAVMG